MSHYVQHSSFQLIHNRIMNRKLIHWSIKGRLWSWLYGSWIYNAISVYHHWCCEFESRSGRHVRHYVIKFAMTCDRSVVFSGSSGFLHQYNWLPRYNWTIVESGVNHYQTNKNIQICISVKAFRDESNTDLGRYGNVCFQHEEFNIPST